ncbi:MAG: hypothetical protein K9M07_02525 [Simkaniaceae bacterium]|nr:hypothetical protein [Simkaniaceae bacterium]
MGDSISPLGASPEFYPQAFKGSYYSEHINEMRQSFAEECRYLIIDPNQLLGMAESFHGFLDFADNHFRDTFQSLQPHIMNYCHKKNADPAFKLTPSHKSKIDETAQRFNEAQINLSPEEFSQGVHNTLLQIMKQLEKEPHSPQLLGRLTGIVSNLCNLPCFSSDQSMNDLFFDLSTYTMGHLNSISTHRIISNIQDILKAL